MKRILMDVSRWHIYLHRDSRGLESSRGEKDDPLQKFEDELFDRLYSGETEAPREEAGPEAPRLG